MAVDTSIYNALGRGVKTVRDWQQEDEQRQSSAQANELNALNLTNARATAGDNALVRQDQATLRNALQSYKPGDDLASLYEGTRTPTGMTQAQAVRKAAAEAESLKAKTAASTAAAGASTASQKATEFKLQIDKHNTALNDILSFQTPAEAMESLRRHAAGGQIPQEAVQAMSRELMGMSTPEQFAQWQESKASGLMDAKSRAELALRRQEAQDRRTNQAGEAANRDLVLDPVTGKWVINQPLNAAKVQRAQAGAPVTMGSPVAGVDPATGQPVFFQPGNRPGVAPQILPGVAPPPKDKPTGEVSRAKDATEALQLIADAEKVIDQATGSYAGAGVDMLGQVVGVSTKGAQASAQLKAVEGMLVSKMPKMSGPQSDKDVALYRQMAGMIGDPTVPAKTKKAALQTIKQIQERYANGSTAGPAPAAAAPKSGATGGWSMQRVD